MARDTLDAKPTWDIYDLPGVPKQPKGDCPKCGGWGDTMEIVRDPFAPKLAGGRWSKERGSVVPCECHGGFLRHADYVAAHSTREVAQ